VSILPKESGYRLSCERRMREHFQVGTTMDMPIGKPGENPLPLINRSLVAKNRVDYGSRRHVIRSVVGNPDGERSVQLLRNSRSSLTHVLNRPPVGL
jgi:hypothetical protein